MINANELFHIKSIIIQKEKKNIFYANERCNKINQCSTSARNHDRMNYITDSIRSVYVSCSAFLFSFFFALLVGVSIVGYIFIKISEHLNFIDLECFPSIFYYSIEYKSSTFEFLMIISVQVAATWNPIQSNNINKIKIDFSFRYSATFLKMLNDDAVTKKCS